MFIKSLQGGTIAFAHLFLQHTLRGCFGVDKCFRTLGVKPLFHQSDLRAYTTVIPFKEKSSFHFAVL